jgi:hypothetical protein
MDRVDFIIAYESGELSDQEVITGFQEMINDGTVWSLQGSYGRMAKDLLDAGYCTLPDHLTYDYYGNQVS